MPFSGHGHLVRSRYLLPISQPIVAALGAILAMGIDVCLARRDRWLWQAVF